MDTLSKEERSTRMSKIRSKDTTPEMILRSRLFECGLRYRKNKKDLPGKPDLIVRKYNLAIEVRGCFWHGHEDCRDGHIPKTNALFWKEKFRKNKARDKSNLKKLKNLGYRVFIVWECEIKKKDQLDIKINEICSYLKNKFGLVLKQTN